MSTHRLAAALLVACCLISPARAAGVPTAELQMAEQAQPFRAAADRSLRTAIVAQVEAAQADGDIAADLDPDVIATWFVASFAGIRIAARGGASAEHLASLGELTLRALR